MELSNCCNEGLVPLSSYNVKICSACLKEYKWVLEPGQQPLIGSSRSKSSSKVTKNAQETKTSS